jgi:pyruvate dehydrogenase E2 component (dihydrolipoamide acetyltransferase)
MSSRITAITMPKWGLTMTEGKVVGWLKREGQDLAAGEELLEIETTKITNVMEVPEPGILRRIVAATGAVLPVGGLLAVAAPESVSEAEINAFVAQFVMPEPAAEGGEEVEAPTPHSIDADGRRLRYLEMGQGPDIPLVLIHGFGGDLNTWMFNQPALAQSRRTLALDLLGHGGSAKDVGSGDPASLADAVEALLRALAIERAHLVGHSLGGAVAALVALRHPQAAASLTLIAAAGFGPEINSEFIDRFIGASRRREMTQALSQLVHDPASISRAMVEEALRYKRLDGVAAALTAIARAWFAEGRQRVDLTDRVRGLTIPVQLIWGRDDQIIPVTHPAVLAAQFPVHLVADAGHLPQMEKAAEVTRLIRQFVEA